MLRFVAVNTVYFKMNQVLPGILSNPSLWSRTAWHGETYVTLSARVLPPTCTWPQCPSNYRNLLETRPTWKTGRPHWCKTRTWWPDI